MVSILTHPSGLVQQLINQDKAMPTTCFNPHPPVRASATRRGGLAHLLGQVQHSELYTLEQALKAFQSSPTR